VTSESLSSLVTINLIQGALRLKYLTGAADVGISWGNRGKRTVKGHHHQQKISGASSLTMDLGVVAVGIKPLQEESNPSMAGQQSKRRNATRIIYKKEFLISCFRNPACKKKPKNLPDNLGITLDAPRINGTDPCPPFVPPIPYRHPHFAQQRLTGTDPRTRLSAPAQPPAPYNRPDIPTGQQGSNENDSQDLARRLGDNLRMMLSIGNDGPYQRPDFAGQQRSNNQQELARQLEDSLRMMLSIGNGPYQPPEFPGRQGSKDQQELARGLGLSLRGMLSIGNGK